MTGDFRIDGGRELAAALARMGAEAEAAAGAVVDAAGMKLQGDIVRAYQRGPATGRTYRKYNPNRTHRASKAGEAPATDTGRLASGTAYRKTGPLEAEVVNNVVYARTLEVGTERRGARPAWRPAIERTRPWFIARLEAVLGRVFR